MERLFCSLLLTITVYTLTTAEEVRLLDLEPNDAQNIIEQQDTSLKYAPKVDSNVPAVRYLGNEPHNVLEDIYLANQYHGQDGLGGYLYGYSVPDIAKTERKKAGGDLRGAYNYIAGNGQEIKVEYWDDGTGFHQVDNVPKALPEDLPEVKKAKEDHLRLWQELAERNSRPVESPYNSEGQYKDGPLSVQAQNQAKQQYYNKQQNQQGVYNQPQTNQGGYTGTYQGQTQSTSQYQPNAYSQTQYQAKQTQGYSAQKQGIYNPAGGYQGSNVQYDGQSSQNTNVYAKPYSGQNPGQSNQAQGQYGQSQGQYSQSQGSYSQSQGAYGQSQGSYGQNQGQYGHSQGQYNQNQSHDQQNEDGQYNPAQDKEGQYDEKQDESTGPPKGFFYKFDYPVGIIVQKQGKAQNVSQ